MNYLELTKKTVRYSDTSSPEGFETIEQSTDFVSTAADFVTEAWSRIQIKRENWDWRTLEFSMATAVGKWEYAWNELFELDGRTRSIPNGIGFRAWIGDSANENAVRWLKSVPANNYAASGPFNFQPYPQFRVSRLIRSDIQSQPNRWTVAPNRKLQIYPIPDDKYQINGQFSKGVQLLRSEEDIPEGIEEEYQDLIVWYAVMLLHGFDDAKEEMMTARKNYKRLMRSFERIHLPPIQIAGPLA